MTWVPTAVQRGLREVADRGLVQLSSRAAGHRSQDFPQRLRFNMSGRNVEMRVSVLARSPKYYTCIHTIKQMHAHTHTERTIHILLCSLAGILSS